MMSSLLWGIGINPVALGKQLPRLWSASRAQTRSILRGSERCKLLSCAILVLPLPHPPFSDPVLCRSWSLHLWAFDKSLWKAGEPGNIHPPTRPRDFSFLFLSWLYEQLQGANSLSDRSHSQALQPLLSFRRRPGKKAVSLEAIPMVVTLAPCDWMGSSCILTGKYHLPVMSVKI